MGFSLSWLATEGVGRDRLLERLGFEEDGETTDEVGAELALAELPGGWLVLTAADLDFDLAGAAGKVSESGLVLGCKASEAVMFSQVRAFRSVLSGPGGRSGR